MHILAWPIGNQSEQIYSITQNDGYGFIKTNYQAYIFTQEELSLSNTNISFGSTSLINPYYKLKLQYFSNQYYFVKDPYIYIKIKFDSNEGIDNTDQVINSISSAILQYNRVYISDNLFNVNIGDDHTCITNNNKDVVIYEKTNQIFLQKYY